MSFLAPGFFVAGLAAALAVAALHFIVTRRPRSIEFPTARFVPDLPVVARSRSIQFSDLLLLVLRVLTILLVAAALARPVFSPRRERIVRVIAADVSASVANRKDVRDSVHSLYRTGDAIVAFDTAARLVTSPDSMYGAARVQASGSLSAGLVGALRAASHVRDGADSVELVLVSPATRGERDQATDSIRAQWIGRARLVRVARNVSNPVPGPAGPPPLHVTSRPELAIARRRVDTVGAVVAGGHAVIGQFERRWRFTKDSLTGARVIARWVDGEPAAVERAGPQVCTRSTAISMDTTGDMNLRPDVVRLRAALSDGCGNVAAAPDSALAVSLTGAGRLAAASEFPPALDIESALSPWLAILAVALAIVEMVVRYDRGEGAER
jgi:aerotolerance regulator-like protein